ncbi:hypothetical protein F0E07_002126 [Escherichia coli]|nr:hypothetical protein [Escherichia coli]EFA0782215.1 hypothetical protein [Escherichia coli]EHM1938263.1 hypothetical protein [Escherichia coli]EKA1417502.1 hypothetical protein [Escherichia coli]MCD3817946.1 hypothetical protein [Escherichia coli]
MTHKTKATCGGRQWENTKHKPEHHSDLLAGGAMCSVCWLAGGLFLLFGLATLAAFDFAFNGSNYKLRFAFTFI